MEIDRTKQVEKVEKNEWIDGRGYVWTLKNL